MISLNIKSLKKKNINLGLEILRMFMSFWVVLNHCYKTDNKKMNNIIFRHRFHVPSFIIMSFYFLNNNLKTRNIKKVKSRLERLIIPYIVYPIIFLIINNLLYKCFNINNKIHFIKLIKQLLIGRGYYGVLWFQFNLILLTIAFYIISFLFYNNYLFILQIIGILAYIIQYSNLNFIFFNKYKNHVKFSVGYIAETIPLATTGLTISSIDLINKIKKYRIKNIIFLIMFIFILFKYNIFTSIKGFGKQGFMHNIGGLFFFILFSLFPLNNCKDKKIINIINNLTNFTPGIYFLHIIVYKTLKKCINLVRAKTLLGCIIIYLICYLISFIFYKKLKNTKLSYLFL